MLNIDNCSKIYLKSLDAQRNAQMMLKDKCAI